MRQRGTGRYVKQCDHVASGRVGSLSRCCSTAPLCLSERSRSAMIMRQHRNMEPSSISPSSRAARHAGSSRPTSHEHRLQLQMLRGGGVCPSSRRAEMVKRRCGDDDAAHGSATRVARVLGHQSFRVEPGRRNSKSSKRRSRSRRGGRVVRRHRQNSALRLLPAPRSRRRR